MYLLLLGGKNRQSSYPLISRKETMNELEAIRSWNKVNKQEEVVLICDIPVTVKPIGMGKLGAALKAIQGSDLEKLFGGGEDINVLSLLVNTCDNCFDLIVLCCDKDREWLEELPLDEGVKLATVCFTVNKDFFTQKVWPLVQGMIPNSTTIPLEPEIGLIQ